MLVTMTEIAQISTLLSYSPMQVQLEHSANGYDIPYDQLLESYWWNMCEEVGKCTHLYSDFNLWYIMWRGTAYSTNDEPMTAGRILLEAAGMDMDETFDVKKVLVKLSGYDSKFHPNRRTALLIDTTYCIPVTPQEAAEINGE